MAFICTLTLLILQGIFKIQVPLKSRRVEGNGGEGGVIKERKRIKKQNKNMLRPEWNASGTEARHFVT